MKSSHDPNKISLVTRVNVRDCKLTLFGFRDFYDGVVRAVPATNEEISGSVELVDVPSGNVINDMT